MRIFSTMMVCHLADALTDAQMSLDRCVNRCADAIYHCRWQCIQGQDPWDQTNKALCGGLRQGEASSVSGPNS